MDIKNKIINKDTDKYKILLKFVNKILINISKNEIDDLIEFINIDRDDVIKEINIDTLKSMEKELFKYYNKDKCGYLQMLDEYVQSGDISKEEMDEITKNIDFNSLDNDMLKDLRGMIL